MTVGTSLLLIAVGAILKYALNLHVPGVDLRTVGVVLMFAGVLGLIVGVFLLVRGAPGEPPPPGH